MMLRSKLTGVFFRGFQTIIEPTFLNLERLTFLYGPNSSGKSAVLDALKIFGLISRLDRESNPRYWLRQYENGPNSGIGIEWRHGFVDDWDGTTGAEARERKRWGNTEDFDGEYHHLFLHRKLRGKKIQVELSERGGTFKVAVDGQPFFEIQDDGFEYTDMRTPVVGESDQSNENFVFGKVTIYRNSPLFKDFFLPALWDLAPECHNRQMAFAGVCKLHRKLIVRVLDDRIEVFNIFHGLADWDSPSSVYVTKNLDDLLSRTQTTIEKDSEIYGQEAAEFFFDHFNPSSDKYEANRKARLNLDREITNLAELLDLYLTGFLFAIRDVTEFAHVSGGRGLLDSNLPFYSGVYDPRLTVDTSSKEEYLIDYAKFLARGQLHVYAPSGNPLREDFVNECLSKYLTSLREYTIVCKKLNVAEPSVEATENRWPHEIVYLYVEKNENKTFNFQDVGSGLSYVFPILAALWWAKLAFIEQPELHLHPSAQCELGDALIAAFHLGHTAVVESHSEHILLRVLRRIRETGKGYLSPQSLKFNAENLNIYYFEPIPERGTVIKRMRVDQFGELLSRWPGGFFAERDAELFS